VSCYCGEYRGDHLTSKESVLLSRITATNSLTLGRSHYLTRHNASTSTRSHVFAFGLCCDSNETRTPIANPRNSAQLQGTPPPFSKLHPGPCSSVGMRRGTDTQTRVTIHFASSTTHAKCNNSRGIEAFVVHVVS